MKLGAGGGLELGTHHRKKETLRNKGKEMASGTKEK